MRRYAGISGIFLLLLLSLNSHSTKAACSCASVTCTCSGDDVSDLSGLLVDGVCPTGGQFTKLVLQSVPNLLDLPQGFEPLQYGRCNGLQRLQVLELHQTGIRNLSSNLFKGLPNLQTLDLSNNSYLKSYREEAFKNIGKTLMELIATDNRVHSLTKGIFVDLRNLQRLILSRNKIGFIEEGVFSSGCCGRLIELSLEGNILTDLEDATFDGLKSLQKLDLRGNPLQRLSPLLFSPFDSSLTHLWMSHNDSATFGGFGSLPEGLFAKMSRLEELSMVELKISNLTADSFKGLINLKKLSLRGNRLTVLSKGYFASLPQLERLDLSANGMVCIPDNSAERYPKLHSLDLSLNGLTHLTKRSFSMLASFQSTAEFPQILLNISFNPIQRIEADTFCGLNSVKLILTPEGTPVPSWARMDGWPDNPFALVGTGSIIQGLNSSGAVQGRSDAETLCGSEGHLLRAKITQSSYYKTSKYSENDIKSSLNSECPWLLPDELSSWQLSKLGVPGLPRVPGGGSNGSNALEEGSRIYLLIIVAVCIAFLLAALTIIMCYRAWSRQSAQKIAGDLEANIVNGGSSRNMEPLPIIGEVSEKHDLLESSQNGKVTTPKEAAEGEEDSEHLISRSVRRNSEPKGEEMETMTAFGVL